MRKYAILATIAGLLLVGGGLFYFQVNSTKNQDKTAIPENKPYGVSSVDTDDIDTQNSTRSDKSGYTGKILAGKKAKYLDFNINDYRLAHSEGKVILLNFYANWCPVCRGEAPELLEGFNELDNLNIIAFRVNFNDSDTDNDEKQLAEEFKIPYQHTKVIIKGGQEISRSNEAWDRDRVVVDLGSL